MRSELSQDSDGPYSANRRYSHRFCRVHDPSDASSQYQVDLYYRDLFQHELMAESGAKLSVYEFHLPAPQGASVEERRKAVFDRVHAFPRRSLSPDFAELSFAERVWVLYRRKRRAIDIARELDVSRQAVDQALRKLDRILATYRNEAKLAPDTHEAFTFIGDGEPRLLVEVADLRVQGLTTAQIARRLGYFKHTIKAVYRWIETDSGRV